MIKFPTLDREWASPASVLAISRICSDDKTRLSFSATSRLISERRPNFTARCRGGPPPRRGLRLVSLAPGDLIEKKQKAYADSRKTGKRSIHKCSLSGFWAADVHHALFGRNFERQFEDTEGAAATTFHNGYARWPEACHKSNIT